MRTPRPVLLALVLLAAIGLVARTGFAQPPRGGTRAAPPKAQPKAAKGDAKPTTKPARPAPSTAAEGDEDEARPLTPLEQVEADAQACRTAAEAVQVYKIFLANPKLAPENRKPAERRLAEWVKMEEQDMRRLGKKWIPQEEYEEIARKTDNLIRHSFELMKLGNNDLAKKDLVTASRLNPESGKADFVMGFIYSLIANNDAKAIAHFNEVLKREPNNAYALNNLAVSEVFLKRYAAATKHFRRALEIMPDLQEVCDNVAVAIGMDGQVRHRQIPDDQAEELNELYRKAIYELKLLPFSAARSTANQQAQNGPGGPGGPGGGRGPKPGMGMQGPMGPGSSPPSVEGSGGPGGQGQQGGRAIFAYKLFGPSGRAMAGSAGQQGIQGLLDEPKEVTVSIGNGTGFVIAPGYILTNHHVVEGATDVTILDPNDREKHLAATVIAESESPDLALLRCDELTAEPLPLAETMPRRGTEIMVLGYPGGSLLGLELKSTRGPVTSAADPKLDGGAFLFDANVNPGNSGGPVIDKSGKVVGVVVAIVRTSLVGSAYSVGIPMERVWPFLEEHLPDVEPLSEKGTEEEWVDIDERCGPSTVFITAKVKRGGKKADGKDATDDFAQGGQGAPGGPGFPGGPPGSVPPGSLPPGGSYPPGGSFPPGSVPPGSVPPGSYPPGGSFPPGSVPPGSAPPGLSGLPGGSPPPAMAPGYPGSIPPDRLPGGGAPGAPGADGGPPSSGGYPPPGSPPPGTPGGPPSSGGYPPPGSPPPGTPGGPPSSGGYPPPGSPPPGTPGGPPSSGGYPPPGTPGPTPGAGSPTPPAP